MTKSFEDCIKDFKEDLRDNKIKPIKIEKSSVEYGDYEPGAEMHYILKFNWDIYEGHTHDGTERWVLLQSFYERGFNFETITCPRYDSNHLFTILKFDNEHFYLFIGVRNSEPVIKVYEYDKKTLLDFLESIALAECKYNEDMWKMRELDGLADYEDTLRKDIKDFGTINVVHNKEYERIILEFIRKIKKLLFG